MCVLQGMPFLFLDCWSSLYFNCDRWDKICLEPGVSWEEGFCAGLVKSRIFVPLLSRGAINHPDKDWQNFSKLTVASKCDNVLLEHVLSLELQARGLIDVIYPVMLGEVVQNNIGGPNGSVVYRSNYYSDGSHPVLPEEEVSVVVPAVQAILSEHLHNLSLGKPLLKEMTVSRIVNQLLTNNGKVVEGDEVDALQSILVDLKSLVDA